MISDDRELRIPLEVLIKVFIAPHYAQSFVFSLAIAAFNVRRGGACLGDCITDFSLYAAYP